MVPPALRFGCLCLALLALAVLSSCASLAPSAPAHPAPAPEKGGGIPDKPVYTFDPPSGPQTTDVEDPGTNVRVNQDSSGRDQNETTISIDPTDSANVIGGANDAREGSWAAGFYVSHDGGQSWSDGVMPYRKYPNQGDPTISFCGDGTALYGYLDYSGSFQPHRLIVSHSSDAGDTWLNPGVVHEGSIPFADKPYLACGPSGGMFSNRAYISWTHFLNVFSGVIRVAYSDDYGQTWLNATNISGGGVQGSVPVPGRDGQVYVFWKGPSAIEFAQSSDGGGSWSGVGTVSPVNPIGDTSFRRNSFPTAAIDISGSDYDGNVYAAWSDDSRGDPDIFFSRSTDGGSSWDPAIRVNDDPEGNGRDQFFPWMAVDERGNIHLMWHDRRDDADNNEIEVYIATSRDGGQSFDRNLKVTDVSSRGSLTGFLGDYAALAARDGKIIPLWSDLRAGTGEEDVYIEVEPVFDYDIVSGVLFEADEQTVDFDDQEPRLGSAIVYDVVTGDVADLSTADRWSSASCQSEDLAAPPATVTALPAPGHALYVLLRAEGPRGEGSYGSGSMHPDSRDGLDETSPCAP